MTNFGLSAGTAQIRLPHGADVTRLLRAHGAIAVPVVRACDEPPLARETHREDVQIGGGAQRAVVVDREHGHLDHREVAVGLKKGPDHRNSGVHC